MDRTVIDTWKAEEKEFGEKLHKKLTALTTMIQPPTDEFKKCFVEDMFLKPNQKAFFHVMHYLFTLLDPIEFKKRFYWPIVDKKSEANFRSSTIQYLVHLNEKHNLQWVNIKSYLVVMPGGMKFIVFLLDLIDFISKELIKQREKSILCDLSHNQVADFSIIKMMNQNKIHKEYASRYIKETELQIVTLKENLESLRKYMNNLPIPIAELIDDTVLSNFALSNRKLFKESLKQNVNKVASIEKPLKDLKEKIERFQNQESGVKYDREMVKRSLLKIKLLYPDLEIGALTHGTDVQLGVLLNAFNHIYPDIESNIAALHDQSERKEFIGKELSFLEADILQLETQLTKFLSSINGGLRIPQTKITPVRPNVLPTYGSTFFSKFVNTPPIKLDMVDNKLTCNPRLPFLDDFAVERSIESFCFINRQNTFGISAPRSAKKSHDSSLRHNQSSVSKSKLIDPLRMLRTLTKDTSKSRNTSRNLSSLASKWKKHENLFGREEDDASQLNESLTIHNMTSESPFNSNEKTTVAINHLDISLTGPSIDANIIYSRKFSAVKKVQDASLNIQNLSTSPSGRLDPLVPFDPKEFPKILLNDLTFLETSTNNFIEENESEKTSTFDDMNCSFSSKKKVPSPEIADLNESKLCFDFKDKMKDVSSDAIFDISDGVLKDVTM